MKKYLSKTIILGVLMLLATQLMGQISINSGVIFGKIIDADSKKAVEFATISIMNAIDSSLVTGDVSANGGKFILKDIPVGKYYAIVSFIGYEEYFTDPFEIKRADYTEDLGAIQVIPTSHTMNRVVVKGREKTIVTKIDMRVYNASQDITSQSGSALQMLRNVPSVAVDADGTISLRGKQEVKILIDGRPSSFTVSDLLRQIPGSRVDKVEIITNPGAKYNPEGTAGIINIVLKKNEKIGFNGNVNIGIQQATYTSGNAGIGLNMRNKHFNIYMNYGYSYRKRAFHGDVERFIHNNETDIALISKDENGNRTGGGHQIKLGMDYYLNEWNTLYWSASYRKQDNPGERTVDYFYYNAADMFLSGEQRYSTELDDDDNYNFTLGWIKKFANPEHHLDVDISYDAGNEIEYEEYFDKAYNADKELGPIIDREKQDQFEFESQMISRIDYVKPFSEHMTLEAGLRHDWRIENTDSKYYEYNSNEDYFLDETRSNLFKYNENVIAAYLTWGQEIGNFGYKVGLRHETTFLTSELARDNEVYEQNYGRLYPSVHLSQKLGRTNTFTLSYSRRIERPSTWQLNPFSDYNDPLSLRYGNPFLEPEDIHSIEAGYKKIWKLLTLNLNGYYRVIGNKINRYVENTGAVTESTFKNIGTSEEVGIETIINVRPTDWLNFTTTLNAYQASLSNIGTLQVSNRKAFRFRGQLTSQIILPGDNIFQISGHYTSPHHSPQAYIGAFRILNLAYAKSFFDERLNITISARDIFGWMRFKADVKINDQVSEMVNFNWDSRRVGLSISYNFGKDVQKNKLKRHKNSDGGNMENSRF